MWVLTDRGDVEGGWPLSRGCCLVPASPLSVPHIAQDHRVASPLFSTAHRKGSQGDATCCVRDMPAGA